VNANRSRSAQEYPLPRSGGTAIPGDAPGTPDARGDSCTALFLVGLPPAPRGGAGTADTGFAEAAHRPGP
jgi:hypothetical protein